MSETAMVRRIGIIRMIWVPALISLAVTLLRLTGELKHWSTRWFSPETGGIDPTAPHFAVQVEDLDRLRQQLKAAGVEMLDFGGEQLWIRDPDGNTVELRAPAAPRR